MLANRGPSPGDGTLGETATVNRGVCFAKPAPRFVMFGESDFRRHASDGKWWPRYINVLRHNVGKTKATFVEVSLNLTSFRRNL